MRAYSPQHGAVQNEEYLHSPFKSERTPYIKRLANVFSVPKKQKFNQEQKSPINFYSQKKNDFFIDSYSDKKARSNFSEDQKVKKIKLPKLYENSTKTQKYSKISTISTNIDQKKKKLDPISSAFKIQSITKTKPGTNGKQTKINQDIAIVESNLPLGVRLYCICDGHGLNGHLVSTFIKQFLVKFVTNALKRQQEQPQHIQYIFQECLRKTNKALLQSNINTQLSGSTVIAVFIYKGQIYSFNVGDSRAILATKREDQWKIIQLSQDQKPSRQDEKLRIIRAGGRVEAQRNQKGEELGPLRVWMKTAQMPGLAMTRSFGDKAGIKAGTISQPELIKWRINPEDKFLIIASDGIWQYLQNDEVVEIIVPFYLKNDIDMGGQKLVRISSEIWQKISYSRDDITLIIVTLNPPTIDDN